MRWLILLAIIGCNGSTQKDLDAYMVTKDAIENKKLIEMKGRFQLITHGDLYNHSILLDTSTGKMWKPVCFRYKGEACKDSAWQEQDILGINFNKDDWYAYLKISEKNKE